MEPDDVAGSASRDMVPKTEEDALITVVLHRFVRQYLVFADLCAEVAIW